MASMENTDDITLEQITTLAGKLKRLDKQWAEKLAELMKKSDSRVNTTKVYDITNSRVKHQMYRRMFIEHGASFLTHLEGEQKRFSKLADKVTT